METSALATVEQMKRISVLMLQGVPTDMSFSQASAILANPEVFQHATTLVLQGKLSAVSDIDWRKVYRLLGMEDEFSKHAAGFAVLSRNLFDPLSWIVPMVKGLTLSRVIKAFREKGVKIHHDGWMDKLTNDRDPQKGSYLVSFRRNMDADPENLNWAAKTLADRGHEGATFVERLLLGFGFFAETGGHLDPKTTTLCTGSRYGKEVPYVSLFEGAEVSCYYTSAIEHSERMRSRTVVGHWVVSEPKNVS